MAKSKVHLRNPNPKKSYWSLCKKWIMADNCRSTDKPEEVTCKNCERIMIKQMAEALEPKESNGIKGPRYRVHFDKLRLPKYVKLKKYPDIMKIKEYDDE